MEGMERELGKILQRKVKYYKEKEINNYRKCPHKQLFLMIINKNEPLTMTVKWKSIAISTIVDQIKQEKGEFILVKMDELLTNKDEEIFKYKIGLARHEYLDAILVLPDMKYSNKNKYAALDKLCNNHLIPFIWNGFDNASEITIKSIFRPFNAELHKLFIKYNCIESSNDANDKLLSKNEWMVFVENIFKYGVSDKNMNGKPNINDIIASFQLAKQGYDLQLTYKGFERALQNLAYKIYKNKPNAKYKTDIKYYDKLKQLLKWCVKLEKYGYNPTAIN